ncbi:putative leucine-rich repeat-containing protein DDB_G0290503 [Gigantopelta aegis]|uniref:putative leucine-rich repeat-containing protein DDB_G0290503 n=1 Tax=Gigantopelta aegis TaxID=1735272 RepID=UPI001B88B3DA|nr:putative leucine-rich repeat-containing protein DDB_G0290503 [Gigantopelta aegis]
MNNMSLSSSSGNLNYNSTSRHSLGSHFSSEALESQLRKVQVENSTLQTENKLLKEKYNRATVKITELESQLADLHDELVSIQERVREDLRDATSKIQADADWNTKQLQAQIATLTRSSDSLKSEVSYLQKQLESARKELELANSEKSKTCEGHKTEISCLKDEIARLKELLKQDEERLLEEATRSRESRQQTVKLNEMIILLQQQIDTGGTNMAAQKQVNSLEKRLQITEERLHQEHADRANNLSQVEEKLLSENAKLQALEKELTRQLQRERDKNGNLDLRIRDLKADNDKLRLSVPLDESLLTLGNNWDILDGNQNQHKGQKELQDFKVIYESKMSEMQEKIDDIRSEKMTFENQYHSQLSSLVKEKHEACARLKTLEDMMDAIRTENDILRHGLSTSPTTNFTASRDAPDQVLRLTEIVASLESKTELLARQTHVLQADSESVRRQLVVKETQLEEVTAELLTANQRLAECKTDHSKQEKIDQLLTEVSSLQTDLEAVREKCRDLIQEKSALTRQLEDTNRQLGLDKARRKDGRHTHASETKLTSLESELDEKDKQLVTVTTQYHQVESELQHSKQELFYTQEHAAELEKQVENLQKQLNQRCELWDSIAAKENELLQQLNVVKSSLEKSEKKFNHSQSELKVVKLELSQSRVRIEQLERLTCEDDGATCVRDLHQHDTETDQDRDKTELLQTLSALQSTEEEKGSVTEALAKAKQDLLSEKSVISKLTAEKVDIEHKLQDVSVERDALYSDKSQLEDDLVKLERKLQDVLHKFEEDVRKQHGDFRTSHHADTPQTKQLVSELNSLKLLLMSKDKEVEMMSDKLNRPNMEVSFLRRRVEILRNENQFNKEDINRLTNELILKMKENTVVIETNVHLVTEKCGLEKEIRKLHQELMAERDVHHRQKTESADFIRKIEQTEQTFRHTAAELQEKKTLLVSMETDLQHVKRQLSGLEAENEQLKVKVDHLNEDVRNLTSINTTLETRLDMERSSLAEEKMSASQKKEDLTTTSHRLEALKHEQSMLLNNLSAERKNSEQLREEVGRQEQLVHKLTDDLKASEKELDSKQEKIGQLQEKIDQLKNEKSYLYQDYEAMCRKLGEKDKEIADLKESYESKIESLKKEVQLQQAEREHDGTSLAKNLHLAQAEIVDLNEELKKKELQLSSYGRALQELHELSMQKKEMESKMSRMESRVAESQILLESHRNEMISFKEANQRLQDELSESQIQCHTLQQDLRNQKELASCHTLEFNHRISDLQSQKDTKVSHLKEALNQMEQKLQSTQQTLDSVHSKFDQLQVENRSLVLSVDHTGSAYTEECTARKHAEEKLKSAMSDIDDIRREKLKCEERILELQKQLGVAESQLKTETEHVHTLSTQLQETKVLAHSLKTAVKAKQEKTNMLQAEVVQLQQALDTEKQLFEIKLHKTTLELRQKIETGEQDREKLTQQVHLLSVSLEQAREQLAAKNKDNLKLNTELLDLQESLHDNSNKLRQAIDSLRIEEEMQSTLSARFEAQEEELKKLKTFLAKKCESESGDKTMWLEMDKMVRELSQQMHEHLESRRLSESSAKDHESRLATSYRRQIDKLTTEVSTERALHSITRNSLQAVEEDTARLRAQVLNMRQASPSPNKSQKCRIEAINELIARSQIRAQHLLPTSLNNTSFGNTNVSCNTTFHVDDIHTPDDMSQVSECSLGPNNPVYLAMLNMSGTFPSEGSSTPRK